MNEFQVALATFINSHEQDCDIEVFEYAWIAALRAAKQSQETCADNPNGCKRQSIALAKVDDLIKQAEEGA